LVGGRFCVAGPGAGEMSLDGFDVALGLAAPAVAVFKQGAGVAPGQVGDDAARVLSLRADLDARDDALDMAIGAREDFHAKRIGVDALLMAGGAHRQPKPDDVGHAVRDLSAVARIDETGREPPLDRGPRQCAAVPR